MLNMWWPTRINLCACLRAVVTRAKVQPCEDVLVLGASGGVAVAAIQIFKLIGARVFAIISSEKNMEKICQLGADFAINRNNSNPFDEVRRLARGRGVDLVIENTGAATWSDSQNILRKAGRVVTYGRSTRHVNTNLSLSSSETTRLTLAPPCAVCTISKR